ncbi:lactonase family protein [Liquorilactobacillus nagelii]|uniref:lactonase family protein n=1 Tax=Liquorilactobacillus nagelii TaxID=82688 RepID=UPI001CCCE223|nr:lactonase family protein [Liquorilactobacillus nagelii]ULQ48938.1 lactonase family protein [Liquorilactobacillus nagelii]
MTEKIFFGTYTKKTSQGIYQADLNETNNTCSKPALICTLSNPTYLNINRYQQIFAVVKDNNLGGVAQLNLNSHSAEITEQIVASGAAPCYIGIDNQRDLVFSANYHTGVVRVYRSTANQPFKLLSEKKFSGKGPRPEQEASHIHYADLTPDQRLTVCDLGADRVYTFEITAAGTLTHEQVFETEAGFAPRHLVFHPNGNFAFLVGELSSQIAVLKYNALNGTFSQIQQLTTIPATWDKHNGAAAIKISADGKFIYVSNRGHDSIAVFAWDQEKLRLIQTISVAGSFPRDFAIDPTGKFLLVANQESDNATLFSRSIQSGQLAYLQKDIPIPEGVCVKFIQD